jgi:diguanylate cyclase (GGDEF)-like protein
MSFFQQFSVKARLLLFTVLPALAVTGFITLFVISKHIESEQQHLIAQASSIARQIAISAQQDGKILSSTILNQQLSLTKKSQPLLNAVLITDSQGLGLASVGTIDFRVEQHQSKQADKFQLLDHIIVSHAEMSLGQASGTLGYVYVALNNNIIQSTLNNHMLQYLALLLVGLLLCALLANWVANSISKPIKHISNSIKSFSAGNLDLRINEDAPQEIRVLQAGFNDLVGQIQNAHEHLQDRVHDATKLLRHQAQHDSLTGLVNRQEFERRLSIAVNDVKINHTQHIFCYMDLDQFKVVNDTCGHRAGDELLRQISLILMQRVREEDTFARLGGDEFGLLLSHCTVADALSLSEQLKEMVQEFRFIHDGRMFQIGISIGVVEITPNMNDLGDVTGFADAACYAAKENGRNQVHLFQPLDDEQLKRHLEMQWVSRINESIESNNFTLYCQAITPLQDESLPVFYEVLLRKIDEDGSLILPMMFIPSAERYHLMAKVDRWVINKTFALFQEYAGRQQHQNFLLTINLSGMSVGDLSLLDYLKEAFINYGVPPERMCFEITETSAIININNTIHLIKELQALGCKFLLDDFGSGMSSFSYLKNLPVDFLKMDGAYVKDITHNPTDLAMAKAIQSIAESMNIKTIAEFVESKDTLDCLKTMNVDYAQGYYINRPTPIEEVLSNI